VLVQQENGMLVTGTADFDCADVDPTCDKYTLPHRVWSREFDADFQIDDPGFNALGAGSPSLPGGSQALPGDTDLTWDFWPMRIDDMSANLFYWNGLETDGVPDFSPDDVRFGPLPSASYRLYYLNLSHYVDGADAAVRGGVIDTTAADGFIHKHNVFFLDDGDGNALTDPADGIYLLSMRLRMAGLQTSLPIYMVFGTLGSDAGALDLAAAPWVMAREDTLVLLGDYNRDGAVTAADYPVWRNSLGDVGFALAADGDASDDVGINDYLVWKENYGKTSPTTAGGGAAVARVPEPSGLGLSLLMLAACAIVSGRARREKIGST
jgi:hypothetical protein